MSTLQGQRHHDLLGRLQGPWLTEGPPVCVVQGFPGTGKTRVAGDLHAALVVPHVMIEIPDGDSVTFDDVLLEAIEKLKLASSALAQATAPHRSLAEALETAMRTEMVLIIDEFQRAFRGDGGSLLAPYERLLQRLASQRGHRGRLLLLTSRRVDEGARWTEHLRVEQPLLLDVLEGRTLLDALLAEHDRDVDIPADRRDDVVGWLGRNPRAMRVLVAGLASDSLDELIGVEPESWEVRDREVSPELLHSLEGKLLVRALDRVDAPARTLLRSLSIYRKPFDRHGVDAHLPVHADGASLRRQLADRFLLDGARGWFGLHPIAREIGLGELRADEPTLRGAHGRAADHYARHFQTTQLGAPTALGGHFVEARYHLVRALREAELGPMVRRFQQHLSAQFGPLSPVPENTTERGERIATISALLQEGGPEGLHYYLARLLDARRNPGDPRRALEAVRRACGARAPDQTWAMRIRLEGEIEGVEAAVRVTREGLAVVAPDQNAFALYGSCAELLAESGRVDQAIAMLKEGIARIPPDKSLFALYESCAKLLAESGRVDQAIAMLKEGIARIPPDQNLSVLYRSCGKRLAESGRVDQAIAMLKEGIECVPDQNLSELYRSCATLLTETGCVDEAIQVLKEGISRAPPDKGLASLYTSCGRLLMQSDHVDDAVALLRDGASRSPPVQGLGSLQRLLDEFHGSPGTSEGIAADVFERALATAEAGLAAPGGRATVGPLERPRVEAPRPITGGAATRSTVLAVATEWASSHGGLSTFNRELCIAWASARPDDQVLCLVPAKPSSEEHDGALALGVKLVPASEAHGLPMEARLAVRPALPEGVTPHIILGHGRVTGPAASALQAAFPGSRRVHFIHVAPEEIEYFKDQPPGETASQKGEDRTLHDAERAASADLAVAVGPRLARVLGNELHARGKLVHEILPGLSDPDGDAKPPPALQCLLLGRAEDYELKGLDIAARALALVNPQMFEWKPWLMVRGSPAGTGDELEKRLRKSAKKPGVEIKVRRYTSNADCITRDIRNSSLVLMPSRAEGFGLVGLEAISASVPVLLSLQSGLGEMLAERTPLLARDHVVPVTGDLEVDAERWARAIEHELRDREASFARARKLRQAVSAVVSWEKAVAALVAQLGL